MSEYTEILEACKILHTCADALEASDKIAGGMYGHKKTSGVQASAIIIRETAKSIAELSTKAVETETNMLRRVLEAVR